MEYKRPWQSRTHWANGIIIVMVLLFPEKFHALMERLKTNSEQIVIAIAALNMIFRNTTKSAIRFKNLNPIFIILLLASCSSVQQQLETDMFYKRDVGIEVNGKLYEGVTTVPHATSYKITLVPKGEPDLMLIRSCHREYSVEKSSSGWFIFGKKNKFQYEYTPVPGIEDSRVCPLRVDVYESGKGRHSWALVDMESPDYEIRYQLTCNGEIISVNGVGVCQAKEQTIQAVKFSMPVRFAPPPSGCATPKKVGPSYEIQSSVGECLYHFDTEDGRLGRLTVVGFQGVLVREAQ